MSKISLRVVMPEAEQTLQTYNWRENARTRICQELAVWEWSSLVQIGIESIETGEHEWFFTVTAPRLRKHWIKGAERLRKQGVIDRYIVYGKDEPLEEEGSDGE
jgi:hypothetical protein